MYRWTTSQKTTFREWRSTDLTGHKTDFLRKAVFVSSKMECSNCNNEYEKDEVNTVPDKDGKPIIICKYCMICVHCDHEITEDIEEDSWILTQEPCFPSGWAFMTDEELDTHYVDRYVLICSSCRTFKCNTCTEPLVLSSGVKLIGMCANTCKTCGWACDDIECDCTK